MCREQERIRRKLESNLVAECNKVRTRCCCPDLFHDFADTKDPRNQSYTEYSNDELLNSNSNEFNYKCYLPEEIDELGA